MSLSFANPTAFWALLLAIPIVAVYLIRNRPSTRSVSTLLFWEQVIEEPGATSFFRSLRHPGSLLLQLALLLLLTLALSDPISSDSQTEASQQVLIIDNSASMKAIDSNGVSRFDLAISEAIAVIDESSPNGQVLILASCPSPFVICPSTRSRALAKSRLNAIRQTDCVGRIEEAIAFAGSIVISTSTSSLCVITDGNDDASLSVEVPRVAAADPSNEASGPAEVLTITVGQPVANVGLTLFQARRASTAPTLWHLLYEVCNFSNSSIEVNLEIRRNNSLIDVLPLNLKPLERRRDVLTKTSTEGGLIVGTLQPISENEPWTDGLSTDNQAISQLAERPMIDVTLVTSGNWFLQQALNANPLVRLSVAREDSLSRGTRNPDGIVIFDGVVPESWPPEQSESPIRALVVAPAKSCRLWTVNGVIDTTFVGDYRQAHPLLEYVQLEDIAINSASDVTLAGGSEAVVDALEGQPLIATYENGNKRVLMLAVNLGRSDLPLRTSFPIFLTNALDWLSGSRPELLPQANTQQPTTIATVRPTSRSTELEGTATWALSHADGETKSVSVVNGFANLGQLTKVGLYQLRVSNPDIGPLDNSFRDGDSLLLPCNLVSQQESHLNQKIKDAAAGETRRVPAGRIHWNIQNILLAMIMLAIVTECWLWHRRIVE